ncbi:MAG: hypothetical protein ACPGGK_04190 [Pikeienuella sp.]
MTERIAQLAQWWQDNEGCFVNLDDVLPHTVVHRAPSENDLTPTPLLLGAYCWQSKLLGDDDISTFQKVLGGMPAYAAAAAESHRTLFANWAPQTGEGVLRAQLPTGSVHTVYKRILLPVLTAAGDKLIMTYSEPVTLH